MTIPLYSRSLLATMSPAQLFRLAADPTVCTEILHRVDVDEPEVLALPVQGQNGTISAVTTNGLHWNIALHQGTSLIVTDQGGFQNLLGAKGLLYGPAKDLEDWMNGAGDWFYGE